MRIGALLLATGWLSVTNLPAQQPSASPQDQVSAEANSVPDSTVPKPKSKGGLFGKAKKLASSKVVQTIAKTAACTMVPGGQAIAGAIDAASSKSAGEAAQGAAAAAGGSSCMPGMGAGMGGAGVAKGLAGASGGAMPGGMPMSAQMSAQMLSPQVQMPGTANGAGTAGTDAVAMGMMPNEEAMAACLGITLEEYHAFSNPTQGQSRPLTKDEMKRQAKIGKKVQGRQQACAMQQAAQAMAMSQQSMAVAQQRMAAVNTQVTTEAPGKQPALASDLVAELTKGKTAVRDIDWVAGGVNLSEPGLPGFSAAMARLAAAMHDAGGSYRIDMYMDRRYGDAELKTLSPSRIAAVMQAIQRTSSNEVTLTAGRGKKDKDPRLEIVRVNDLTGFSHSTGSIGQPDSR